MASRRWSARPWILAGLVVVSVAGWLLGSAVAPARASRLVTWKLHSRFVNPAAVWFGQPPACACTPHPATYLPVNVLLPDRYDGRRRFPVLFLLHGQPSAYDMWMTVPATPYARGGDLRRIANGFPGIIVMPDGGANGWYTNWWNGGKRGDPAWERYFLDELIPLVQRRLRVLPGRASHAIGGWSMGGFGAALLGSERPGYFGIVALMSPALRAPNYVLGVPAPTIFGDAVAQRFYRDGHDPFVLIDNLRATRLFVVNGDAVAPPPDQQSEPEGALTNTAVEGFLRGEVAAFVSAARRAGIGVTHEQEPGIHDHVLLRRELPDVLSWVRRQYRRTAPVPDRWSYRTVAQTSDAYGFRFSFRRPPTKLITFTRNGRRLSATGAGMVNVRTPDGHRFTTTLPFRNHRIGS